MASILCVDQSLFLPTMNRTPLAQYVCSRSCHSFSSGPFSQVQSILQICHLTLLSICYLPKYISPVHQPLHHQTCSSGLVCQANPCCQYVTSPHCPPAVYQMLSALHISHCTTTPCFSGPVLSGKSLL